MNSNTSAGVTATGSLSITAKNTRRSDTVASTVFGLHLAATNSTYLASTTSRPHGPNATSNDDDIPISDQPQADPRRGTPPASLDYRNIYSSARFRTSLSPDPLRLGGRLQELVPILDELGHVALEDELIDQPTDRPDR